MQEKIISIIPAGGGIVALNENGELFFGNFIATQGGLGVPEFLWRQIPDIPEDALEYKISKELKPAELAKRIKRVRREQSQL